MRLVDKTSFIALAAAALLAAACQSDDSIETYNEAQPEQTEISFGLDLAFPPDVTRGTPQLTNITMQGKDEGTGFGVFAVYTGEEDFGPTTGINNFHLDNHRFEAEIMRDNANNILPNPEYYGAPMAYWPRRGKLSFFCYAPYDKNMTQLSLHPNPVGTLTFDYTPSSTDPARQLDLCLAKPALNKTLTTEAVPLHFQHVCSYITFYGRYQGNKPKKYNVIIDEIKLNGVIGSGTLQFDIDPESDGFVWTAPTGNPNFYDTSKKVDYTLPRISGTKQYLRNVALLQEDDAHDKPNFTKLQLYPGDLYLVPQILKGASLDITFSFVEGQENGNADGTTYGNSGTIITQYKRHVAIPDGTVWRPGKICNFNLTIQMGDFTNVQLDVSSGGSLGIIPWGDHDDSDGNIII